MIVRFSHSKFFSIAWHEPICESYLGLCYGCTEFYTGVAAVFDVLVQLVTCTGDTVGMKMMSKGFETVLVAINDAWFGVIRILSPSCNYRTGKKAAPIDWIDRRGKNLSA